VPVYLCAGPYFVNGGSDGQFRLVVRIGRAKRPTRHAGFCDFRVGAAVIVRFSAELNSGFGVTDWQVMHTAGRCRILKVVTGPRAGDGASRGSGRQS
jgi:hypothetical protein